MVAGFGSVCVVGLTLLTEVVNVVSEDGDARGSFVYCDVKQAGMQGMGRMLAESESMLMGTHRLTGETISHIYNVA